LKTLLTESQIRTGVETLADRLNSDYAGRHLTLLGVMTGSIVLLADLIRLLQMPLRVGVVRASSYRHGTERGELSLDWSNVPEIQGTDVLLLDDIFDTGHTLAQLVERLSQSQPASLRSAVLLLKQQRQEVSYRPDYVVFEIPDQFVVGYGLDFNDLYRNLPHIAVLEPHDILTGKT
jgi:hypoxanthine phosphoribosyltransferase